MKVFINQEEFFIEQNQSLANLLESKEMLKKSGFAVAINNSVIPKSDWENQQLNENDQIILIHATAGG